MNKRINRERERQDNSKDKVEGKNRSEESLGYNKKEEQKQSMYVSRSVCVREREYMYM